MLELSDKKLLVDVCHVSKSAWINFKMEFVRSIDFVWKHARNLKHLGFLNLAMIYDLLSDLKLPCHCPVKVALTRKGEKWIKINLAWVLFFFFYQE